MFKIKENKDYKINSFNVKPIITLSIFVILIFYLSNTFLFDELKQVWADSVVDTITVGHFPQGIAYDSFHGRMYVSNGLDNTVSVIDAFTHHIISTITVGNNPRDIAYSPTNGVVYVFNSGSDSLSVINTFTNSVVDTIKFGNFNFSGGIAYDSYSKHIYAAHGNIISAIDSFNRVIANITAVWSPSSIASDPTHKAMYVTTSNSWTPAKLYVINSTTNKMTAIINIGNMIMRNTLAGVTYDPGNDRIYVTYMGSDTVSAIDTSIKKVVATIPVGNNPKGIAYNLGNGEVYVANEGSNSVSVINPSINKVIGTINVGDHPSSIAYNPDNGETYVPNSFDNTVSVITTTHYPFNTEIISAVDGNGKLVSNGYSTSSISITFTVQATAGPNGIAGFQCSLDGGTFNNCYANNQNEITFSKLAPSQLHTIKIKAFDSQGNVDPNPSTFGWYIVQQQPPSHTTITSAVDGNGNTVQNGDSTLSTSITFNIQAIQGSNPIAGFQCSFDNNSFSYCGTATNDAGIISLSNLTPGQHHMIKIISVDTKGNVDPTPSISGWTIITSGQGIQKILYTVDGMDLPKSTTTILESTLYNAIKQLNNNNNMITCNNLNAFINKIKADQTIGQLTLQQAVNLIQQAINVQKAIGCLTYSEPLSSSNDINNLLKPFFNE